MQNAKCRMQNAECKIKKKANGQWLMAKSLKNKKLMAKS